MSPGQKKNGDTRCRRLRVKFRSERGGSFASCPLPLVRREIFFLRFSVYPLTATLLSLSLFFLEFLGNSRSSVKKDAGDGPGGVGWQVGGLRRGPLVPLCAQAKPVDLRGEKIVQDEDDRLGTALEI